MRYRIKHLDVTGMGGSYEYSSGQDFGRTEKSNESGA